MKRFLTPRLLTVLIILPLFSMAQTALENGQAFVQDFFHQKYDSAITYFDPAVRGQISTTLLKQTGTVLSQKFGSFNKVLDKTHAKEANYELWYFYTAFDKDSLDILLTFSAANKLIGFRLVPHANKAQSKGTEVKPNSYNIRSGNLDLPGTLLVADSANQKKLVILIHGSGPEDRDETVGENKPFKDLALGLQHYGISSYRFDKRTMIAPQSLGQTPTVDKEVTDDAVNIIKYFHDNDSFRHYKIYVIGHSLGAYMAPKIALQTKDQIAGVIMLAANARPLEDLLLVQLQYLDSLKPSQQMESMMTKLRPQINYLHGQSFSLSSPKDSLPLQQPASYWHSLKGYNPLKLLTKTGKPFLILQGEKDYQVTMEDFKLWQKAAKRDSKISFKSYPDLSHLFMLSKGTPSPEDYHSPKHIPDYVIEDIAHWILHKG